MSRPRGIPLHPCGPTLAILIQSASIVLPGSRLLSPAVPKDASLALVAEPVTRLVENALMHDARRREQIDVSRRGNADYFSHAIILSDEVSDFLGGYRGGAGADRADRVQETLALKALPFRRWSRARGLCAAGRAVTIEAARCDSLDRETTIAPSSSPAGSRSTGGRGREVMQPMVFDLRRVMGRDQCSTPARDSVAVSAW
jgi:hypothetical protein